MAWNANPTNPRGKRERMSGIDDGVRNQTGVHKIEQKVNWRILDKTYFREDTTEASNPSKYGAEVIKYTQLFSSARFLQSPNIRIQ